MKSFHLPLAKVMFLCLLIQSTSNPAFGATPNWIRQGCTLALTAIVTGKSKAFQWTKSKFTDPDRLTPSQYDALAGKPVDSYFKDDEISPEKLEEFVKEFGLVLHNYNRQRNNGKPFHGLDEVGKDFDNTPNAYRLGLAQNKRQRTLEDLLMDLHRESTRPTEQPPFKERTIRLAKNLAINTLWLPVTVPQLFVREVRDNLRTAFAVAVVVPLIGSYTGLFTGPISNFLSSKAYAQFGWIEMYLTLFLTDLDRRIEAMERILKKMSTTKQEMETVSIKYKMKNLSEEEARKKWIELEEVFVNYGKEMNSLLPDNLARGRSYSRDATVAYPLIYGNALTSSQGEILGFENLIMAYQQLERKDGKLSTEDKARLNQLVERHKLSKDRMGGILATIMLHDMMYPELFRPGFLDKPTANKLMLAQPAIKGALNFEDYQGVYLDSMQKVMNQMGINLDSLKEDSKKASLLQKPLAEKAVVKPISQAEK